MGEKMEEVSGMVALTVLILAPVALPLLAWLLAERATHTDNKPATHQTGKEGKE